VNAEDERRLAHAFWRGYYFGAAVGVAGFVGGMLLARLA
jgi:hypothetical protein